MEILIEQFNYVAAFLLFFLGLFLIITTSNLIKKLFGIAIFQSAVLLFFISLAVVEGGSPPLIKEGAELSYVNPLPHVLVLTAIVVGLATLSVGLALAIRIKNIYGNIEDEAIND